MTAKGIINSNSTLIGLILICVIAVVYTKKMNYQKIDENELIFIKGKLEHTPILSNGNPETNEYIKIKLDKDENEYFFENCSYNIINKAYILNLKQIENISLTYLKKEVNKKEKVLLHSQA